MLSPALADAIDLARVRRALVIKLRHHGDVLLTSPVFTVLKRAAPHAEIDALVYRETAPMLAGHPAIAALHTIDRGRKTRGLGAQVAGEWRLWRALFARRYDLVVHLTDHPRGAWLTRLCGARYAVAPERTQGGHFWRWCFTHRYLLPRATPRHAVEANLDALRRIGVWPEDADKALVLTPGADATAGIATLLAAHRLDVPAAGLRPSSGIDADADPARGQSIDRPLDEPLGATEGRVGLPDDPQFHRCAPASVSARSSATARATCATGNVSRQSESLLPPHPLLPQGRHGCAAEATTRCGTRHGPHSASPLGPKVTTTGVPVAAAMCIGAVSQPTKRRAAPISAPRSASESSPASTTGVARVRARMSATSAASAGSGAPVTTSGQPSAASWSSNAAVCAAGQHLKRQREPGCTTM